MIEREYDYWTGARSGRGNWKNGVTLVGARCAADQNCLEKQQQVSVSSVGVFVFDTSPLRALRFLRCTMHV